MDLQSIRTLNSCTYVHHSKFSDFSGCTPRIMMSFYLLYVLISIIIMMIVIVMIITGAVYISQVLNVTHALQELIINNNNISDDGMAVISEALQHKKSLTTLEVAKCGLSVKGTVVCIQVKQKFYRIKFFKHLVSVDF